MLFGIVPMYMFKDFVLDCACFIAQILYVRSANSGARVQLHLGYCIRVV